MNKKIRSAEAARLLEQFQGVLGDLSAQVSQMQGRRKPAPLRTDGPGLPAPLPVHSDPLVSDVETRAEAMPPASPILAVSVAPATKVTMELPEGPGGHERGYGILASPVLQAAAPSPSPSLIWDVPVPRDEDEEEDDEGVIDEPWEQTDPALRPAIVEEIADLMGIIGPALDALPTVTAAGWADLQRRVHTLKGTAGMAGALRARLWIHRMETDMEAAPVARRGSSDIQVRLIRRFARASDLLEKGVLKAGAQPPLNPDTNEGVAFVVPVDSGAPKNVRVPAEWVDRLITEANEVRLSRASIEGKTEALRRQHQVLNEAVQRMGRLSRDFELEAAAQIEFRRIELQDANPLFDPLELDRFTQMQELARFFTEAVADLSEVHRESVRTVAEQEALLAYQERAIHEVQSVLHRARLIPVETLNDRLHRVAFAAAHESKKAVTFTLEGGTIELDRVLLEKLTPSLEHVLRNAVVHGIEMPADRQARNKSWEGNLRVIIRQDADRVHVVVEDDGNGLRVDKIREKAIHLGLWDADRPMEDRQAADMVCRSGFSTAEVLSQLAGRGVGMDVVRNDILAMGGRFELVSRPGEGLSVSMQVPTTVATAPVIVATAGPHRWAIPVEIVDQVVRVGAEELKVARANRRLAVDPHEVGGGEVLFAPLAAVMGVDVSPQVGRRGAVVLILREGERRLALEVDALSQVVEAPLRPAGKIWAQVPGIVGATVLSDGLAAFVIDPLRAPEPGRRSSSSAPLPSRRPRVLVVDDSVTVRKATVQFLERNGFDAMQAKDGIEALEILAEHRPDVMLLDVEMPRMDGFDCARHVREGGANRDLPIIMITSRLATKHQERALALGVNHYLGKPFEETVLLGLLNRYTASDPMVSG